MTYFERAKYYYENGFWTREQVTQLVVWGKITAEQYETITGEVYQAPIK